uniref:Chromosome 12 open reading frame 71 n=1 Tax=Panthera tigris altaica TaxID=74533 RepID=A0A8C9KHB4_PANTA
MAHSSSSNDGTDSTDCSSESNLSLSVGYFPCEDTSYKKTISREDVSSKGPSIFVPPIQGTWRTESTGRLLRRQDQIQDDPKQFCKLSITLAWDIDVGSNNSDSIVNWDINGVNWWVDKYPEENTQLTLSKLDGLVQKLEKLLENQKDDDDGSAFPESAQEEDFQLFSSSPPDRAQMTNQATHSQRTSTLDTSSVSSGQPEKPEKEGAHASTQAISCVNLRWVFHWLREQILSSLLGRQHPEEATEQPHQRARKKRLSHRGKRIQPQDSLELGHPL